MPSEAEQRIIDKLVGIENRLSQVNLIEAQIDQARRFRDFGDHTLAIEAYEVVLNSLGDYLNIAITRGQTKAQENS